MAAAQWDPALRLMIILVVIMVGSGIRWGRDGDQADLFN